MAELTILYQDEFLVAIDKPAGMLVHRTRGAHGSIFALQEVRNLVGSHVYPVHRLDRPTSGVLLFAKSAETARLACELFAGTEVSKTYLAVARGWVDGSGAIDYPLKRVIDRNTDPRAGSDTSVQEATTSYHSLAQAELPFAVGRYPTARYSYVKVQPKTGRKHQIRRHFKHIHHHLIGDSNYGDGKHNRFFVEQFNCRRLLLHAAKLTLLHPCANRELVIQAPIPDDFGDIVKQVFGETG